VSTNVVDDTRPSPRRRAMQTLGGIAADGASASWLAIPVAAGVAVHIFVYLSLMRHRLRQRAESSAADRS